MKQLLSLPLKPLAGAVIHLPLAIPAYLRQIFIYWPSYPWFQAGIYLQESAPRFPPPHLRVEALRRVDAGMTSKRNLPLRLGVEALQCVNARTGFTGTTEENYSILKTQQAHHLSDIALEIKAMFLEAL